METSRHASPFVSVVIPTHNRAPLLSRAINSVLVQTFSDYEIIVVDDGSTDHTREIIEQFRGARMRYVRLERNCGASRARNVGIQAAQGEWVAFLDSDDEWLPRKLELQVGRLRESNGSHATVVYCLCDQREGSTKRTVPSTGRLHEGDVIDHLLRNRRPPTASAFVVKRASLLSSGGFDEGFPSSNDIDLWLRLAQASNHFLAVNEILVIKHDHFGPQISNDPSAQLRGFRKFDRRWGPIMKQRLSIEAYRRWKVKRRARIQHFQFRRLRAAVARGERISGLRNCLAIARFLPPGFPLLLQGLALATLGRVGIVRRRYQLQLPHPPA
ncbi:MAG: glycosyltransferase family 2 protein [Candidatus Binatia bacterium]